MSKEGFFTIHRCLFEHPIWLKSTPEQKVILISLIEMANHETNRWEWNGEQFEVERGQMVTSIDSIIAECGKGISQQNVRTALKRFEKLGFLTNKSTKTGRLITIVNYSKWQDVDSNPNKASNRHLTDTSQRPNKDLTPNNNDNNDNNDNNIDIYTSEYGLIIGYLNEMTGSNYRTSSKKTRSLIRARLNEDYTVEDFKTVIYKKAKQWQGDSKMSKFLRPETLFGTKFEGYLNEKVELSFKKRLEMA